MYNFQELDNKLKDSKERLGVELKSIQTGRATPLVLDNVQVEAYGSRMQISHLASINIEDAKTLRVAPFDKSVLKDLEKSINDANLGLSVVSDSDGLRVIFPVLTTERRTQYVKLAKEKFEDVRIRIRGVREEAKKDIESKGKAGEFGDDDKKRLLDTLQNKIDSINGECEELFNKKEEEIMGA